MSNGRLLCRRILDSARQAIATTEPDFLFCPEIGMDPVVYFLAFARLAPVQTVSLVIRLPPEYRR